MQEPAAQDVGRHGGGAEGGLGDAAGREDASEGGLELPQVQLVEGHVAPVVHVILHGQRQAVSDRVWPADVKFGQVLELAEAHEARCENSQHW